MAISESIELLGKGLYKGTGIPDVLTLQALPTISELEYISSEDFDDTMIDKILPQAVKEKIDFNQLLEIDYQWVLRCLRILNYGPYHTTNAVYCDRCHERSFGEYRVNLTAVECKPLPEGFVNDILISKDEFLDYKYDVRIALPTIRQVLNSYKDKAFQGSNGRPNRELARVCYTVREMNGQKGLSPIEVRMILEKDFSSSDYMILKDMVSDLLDYGIRAGGTTTCPKCGNPEATFFALMDDRYFRPTLGDLRAWKIDRSARANENAAGSKTKNV